MSLIAIDGTPLIPVGAVNRQGNPFAAGMTVSLLDAANEAVIMIGRIFNEDGGSHTIDTTGSSSLGWRTAAVTFANVGTTVKVGLAAVDAGNGPPARATNVADVITLDVAKVHTGGGGGITGSVWQTNVPSTGTKTVAHGDLIAFCVQMTARAGADAVNVGTVSQNAASLRPCVTGFLAGAYTDQARHPVALITYSDGTLGWFWGGFVGESTSNTTWNSGSATKEYGNLLQFPFPVRVYGIMIGQLAVTGNLDLILYSDPLGTPVAERTASVDLNVVSVNTAGVVMELFTTPYDVPPNTPVAAIVKPTSVTDITTTHSIFNHASHQKCWNNGANGYAVNRASGAFAAQNSNKDRFPIALLIGAFDTGGYSASRSKFLGM